jgi:hypothetical protein
MVIVPVPASDLLVIRNVQACWSLATLADEITEPGASRLLATSAFGYGHDPDGGAASGLVVVADCARVTGGLLEEQAAASKVTRTASKLRLIPVRVRLVQRRACMQPPLL